MGNDCENVRVDNDARKAMARRRREIELAFTAWPPGELSVEIVLRFAAEEKMELRP